MAIGANHVQLMINLLPLLKADLTVLSDGLLDTAGTGKGDKGLGAVAKGEDVGLTGGELVVTSVLKVNNVESTGVLLLTGEDTDTTDVSTLGDHADVSDLEGDNVNDLVGLKIEENRVVDLDLGVHVADGAAIVGNDVGDGGSLALGGEGVLADHGLGALGLLDNLKELNVGLLGGDLVKDEAALGVVKKAELLVGLGDGDDILETSGVVGVGADLVVDLDKTAHNDHKDLTAGKGVLEAVTKDKGEGKALTKLVRTGGGAGSPFATELVKHPVLGRCEALKVLLRSASHG